MKKTLAILLALAMVFSTLTVAFAEDAISADAQAVVSLGMLKGEGAGVTSAFLAQTPSRLTAAIMFLRLNGLEDAALAYTGTENFADADQATWAGGKAIMGYLKTHPELGFVGDQGKLDPNAPMTAQAYYKVMLQALGYKQNVASEIGDFVYEKTVEFAATKGLSKVATVTNFTFNDVAIATVEALKANVKDSTTKTLAAQLIEKKIITEAAAVAAGVYAPAPVVFAVESVTTDNLAQLTVKFNKELKAAGDEDNYTLETTGDAVLDDHSNFELQADKKTVVITLTTVAAQQEKVDLTIEGLEAADGSKLAKTVVEDVELFDKTIPSAVSAKVIGNDTIKVTFSEPMIESLTTTNFKVDGGDLIVKSVSWANNNTEANVELYSVLDNDKVTIEAGTGLKDFATFGIPKKSFELEVVEDTAAPVVVGYEKATPNGVTLIFSEDIEWVDESETLPADSIYHTNTTNDADSAEIDGNKLIIDFGTNNLAEGTAYVYVAKEMVKDFWDNENAKVAYTVQVELDKTAPTITKVEAGDAEDQLVLTFSEDLDETTATAADNYTILDKDGKEVANKILGVSLDEDTVTITFTEDMVGAYSVVVENVEDLAENAIVKVTKAFNISDVTDPSFATDFSAKLYNAGAADQMLKVSFGQAMAIDGRYSVVDLDKYELDEIVLADVKGATIKAVDGNKAVEIVLPSTEDVDDPADGHDFSASDTLYVSRVADAAGNTTPELYGEVALLPEGTVGIDTVELTSKNTIVVTLLDKLTKFNASDFVVFADNNDSAADHAYATADDVTLALSRVRHTINADGVSVVTFTLANNVTTDGVTVASGWDVLVTTKAAPTSENIYGEKLVNDFNYEDASHVDLPITDKAAPTVVSAIWDSASQITITFSEDLFGDTFAATGKNGFSVSGGTLSSAALSGGNKIILTSTKGDFTLNTNVYYNSVFGIKDLNDNKIGDLSITDPLE